MALKSFKYWKRQEVQETFGLQRVFEMSLMTELLAEAKAEMTARETEDVEMLRAELARFGTDWNEATLKFLFLGPFIRLINFHIGIYNPFLEHVLTAKVGDDSASGRVDFMVAQGEQIPKAPYFCLHEHKPEEGTSNDPYGQLLIAMIAAQQENLKIGLDIPVYGLYNLGSIFYFVVLNKNEFIRSHAYDATSEDIFDIYKVLKRIKNIISEVKLN